MTMPTAATRAHRLVREIVADLTAELDVGPIGTDRRLGSLGLESISLVYLVAEVQEELELGDALVAALRGLDVPVPDLTLGQFADLAAAQSEGTLA